MEPQSNQKFRYDTEKLDSIPIDEVLEALGAERIGTSKKFRCFNKDAHKSNDKSASLVMDPHKNYCKCFGCDSGGAPVSLVTGKMNGDFKEACEWLHNTFNIPFLDGAENRIPQSFGTKAKEIEYLSFDQERKYHSVNVEDWLPHYDKLNDERRLKLIYTTIYRFSLSTDQRAKLAYHAGRGIDVDHPLLQTIGYLSSQDLKKLGSHLERTFPKQDLIRFNLFSSVDQEYYPGTWKYWSATGFAVAPSTDLYSDMCNGFMLRNTDANLDKRKPKEIQVCCSETSFPLPFGLTRELLLSNQAIPIHGNEGYIDGLSLGKEKLFVASTGVHGLKEKMFGLLKGREFRIAYDMDNAGIRATRGYSTISVKRSSDSSKEKVRTQYFLKTDEGQAQKAKYIGRIEKFTRLTLNERKHLGLIDTMPRAGVRPVVVSWDTKIDRDKYVTDINDILKEYRKHYGVGLTGKSVEDAVSDLKTFYQKGGDSRVLELSG